MLFILSFLLVFTSSYFIASSLTKKFYEHFSIMLISAFANVVLTFETLSLFHLINIPCVLLLNIIVCVVSAVLWVKKGKPVFVPDLKNFFRKYKNICKLDKTFIILSFSFLVFILGTIFLCALIPVTNADARDYHVARSFFFILNHSLSHVDVADVRALVFPINSEILYAWILMFVKKDAFLGFVSFSGYCLAIASVYKIMNLLGFSLRKTLWSILVLSSFASIMVQISGTETDIFTSSLLISSIALFWLSLKENNKTNLIFASLAYALAVGVKTTAIIAIPAIAIIMLVLSKKYNNYKNFGIFCGFFTINFLVFSSYNYILNFVDYGNIMGTNSALVVHKNFYGIKGMVSTFVRHIFLFVDFTGFKWGEYIGNYILSAKTSLLNILGVASVPEGIYSNPEGKFQVNGTLLEPSMSYGVLGFLALLPCILYSFIKPSFTKNFRVKFLAVLSIAFIVYMLTLSYLIVYMNFNARFLAMFSVIIAPILSYTYFRKNNFYKIILTLCIIYYMLLVSTHFWARPSWHFAKNMLYKGETISQIRTRAACSNIEAPVGVILNPNCKFWNNVINSEIFKGKKILYFASSSSDIFAPLSKVYFNGAKIDIGLVQKLDEYNLLDYDYIILYGKWQYSSYIDEKNIVFNYFVDENGINLKNANVRYYCFYRNIVGAFSGRESEEFLKEFKNQPVATECFFNYKDKFFKNFEFIPTVSKDNVEDRSLNDFVVLKNVNK